MLSVPVLYLDNTILYPGTILIAKFKDQKSIQVINYCIQNDLPVFILLYPSMGKSYQCGTLAKLHTNSLHFDQAHSELRITIEGLNKAKMNTIIQHIPYTIGEIEFEYDLQGEQIVTTSNLSRLKNLLNEWALEQVSSSKDRESFLKGIDNFTKVVNYSCFLLIKDTQLQQLLLEKKTITDRFHLLSNILFKKREHYEQATFLNALKTFSEIPKTNICH